MSEKIINVRVTTNAKKNEIIRISNDDFKIKVTALPIKGKANEAVIKILAGYFQVSKSQIDIIKGNKNKNKLIYIKLN